MAPLVLAALLAAVADPSAAQSANGQSPPAQGRTASSTKDPNRMVCRSEEQVGTNIRVRTCKTQSQWDSQDEQARQYFEDAQARGGITNAPTNPMAPVR
jgi:hypothetical protein